MITDKEIIEKGNIEVESNVSDIKLYDIVYDELRHIMRTNPNISYLAIEQMYIGRPRTAMRLGKLHGYLMHPLYRENGLEPNFVNNMTLKKHITGKGNCSKKEVATALQLRYPELEGEIPFAESTAKTKGRYKTDDIYDAIGLAITFIETELEN